MSALAIDTHKIVKRLRDSGFSEPQAEAVTDAVQEAAVIDLSHLATRSDLEAHRLATTAALDAHALATKADFDSFRQATKADFDSFRQAAKADFDRFCQATKADFDSFRQATKAEIDSFRQATKADLDAHRLATKADLKDIEQRLENKLSETKADILKWMAGTIAGALLINVLAMVGVLYGVARLFAH